MSPLIQGYIDKGLLDRLPPTFSTFFFEQIREWDLLFPAEQNYHERLFGMLDRTDAHAVENLFAPLRGVETKMGVNEKSWPRRRFTLDQVDFLNRSAHYPQWRKAVADIFARIDPMLDEEIARKGRPRLVIVTSPVELPVGPDRLWQRIRHHGKMVPLDLAPEAPVFDPHARTKYDAWVIEAGEARAYAPDIVHVSYEELKNYRTKLMGEVRHIVEAEDIRGPRELASRLKQLKMREGQDPVLAEFTRSVLLSGNGTLLINNTFVEWATIQAARRARPSFVLVSFGVRNKLKPFSSLLIYTDQETATPIPTQMDTLGTYVDLEVFYQYVWQEFEKYPEYRRNTAYLFIAEGMDEMLVIAPPDFPLLSTTAPMKLGDVYAHAKEWMQW